ncbi:hypothetical protein B5T_03204 [Alloalcanivorax dieselolei B5]|uniref:Uncharacterized protein n=1 Tax=Alcanivorax dieselolei (strain DSM 16502 / CGMCC 1.3690 / MCCC 1A00001 / B-5) TaxID=930169 RepID=K0CIR6_ALCDB|nr:hypothetical protein B5T_03204 [Alloalcanivorax dieselolei B5]
MGRDLTQSMPPGQPGTRRRRSMRISLLENGWFSVIIRGLIGTALAQAPVLGSRRALVRIQSCLANIPVLRFDARRRGCPGVAAWHTMSRYPSKRARFASFRFTKWRFTTLSVEARDASSVPTSISKSRPAKCG